MNKERMAEKDVYDTVYQFSLTAKGRRKKLAAFLLRSPNEAALMTIEDIAEAVGASAGMVSRAVRHMGFDGFADMQRLMRKGMLKTLSPSGRLQKRSYAPSCMESLEQDRENLAAISTLNTEEQFYAAAELLATAPAVHVFGLRSSYPLAYFLALCLEQIRDDVHLVDLATGKLVEHIIRFKADDVVALFSFPRYMRDPLLMVEEARRSGCRVLGISDSHASPLGLQADISLASHYASVSFFNSPAAPFALVSALITQTIHRLGKAGSDALDRFLHIHGRWNTMIEDSTALRIEQKP